MRRICLALACLAMLGSACGSESDEEQIRQVVEESVDDEVNAHERAASEWCDTRLVGRLVGPTGSDAWKVLWQQLGSGVRVPQQEHQLRAAAREDRCVRWVERYTTQLRKLDEDVLKESRGGLEITEVSIRGDTARVESYLGEYEEPQRSDWRLVELTEGDWRVLYSSEVVILTPTTD